ncbi:asparagine synthase (glutamine-hydrolysing) [Kaistella chaponensis]|uniref:asparagine synthase (glutamine-hydrolyzing) n=1 Tax=Kaistella chaponensis TaxID=713588 RepID=A0A1N7J777_9FLAO|nr:asparagine synthase (glutamine-hydrolyzing) [Kaistella chaponensis]SIS45213.1 asparagine synthase (glutamine-hydrolysing) [Kaistella chaponensis]
MCGIAGIILKNQTEVQLESLKKMTDKISHRGPDAEGFFIKNNVGFGHRRLSILDVSDASNQPFHYKTNVLTFNGAIYNYLEIKIELETVGYQFTTTSDTEVLLAAYHYWGQDCVQKFNGMWSFAIFDEEKNIIFCSKDRFGVKPFYYYADEEKFVFASEIKAVLEIKKVTTVNTQIILQFIETNFTEHNNETFFEGIFKLPGSHSLVYDLKTNVFQIYKYYELEFNAEVSKLNLQDSINLFEEKFQESIKLRLRSDVKIGSALSGGLDSSYIVAISAKQFKVKKDFNAVTVGSLHKEEDEGDRARIISDCLGIENSIIYPDKNEFEKLIPQVIYSLEEPFGGLSVYMQTFLMKQAQKLGIKVLLDGQGADEVLLGYSNYTAAFLKNHGLKDNVKFLLNLRSHYDISIFKGLLIYLYYSNFNVRKTYLKLRGLGLKSKYKKLIEYNHIRTLNNSYKNIFELQKNEIFWAQIPQLLRWEDMNSMAYGIETRLPYLDYKFVETCLSINNNFKIFTGWSKYILRKNLQKHIPDEIAWNRKKIGFNPPIEEWWPRSEEITNTINNSQIIKELFKDKFNYINDRDFEWKLYNIAIWEKLYDMKISPE